MKLVLQRVSKAHVRVVLRHSTGLPRRMAVADKEIARIGRGLLVLVGIVKGDTPQALQAAARKVLQLRIFEDDNGRMNRSVRDIGGELLVVSQFTLAADLTKGTRPGFDPAEKPEKAKALIADFTAALKESGLSVREGEFGASMEVALTNDGPVTFVL